MKRLYLLTVLCVVLLISIFSYCTEADTDRDGVIDEKDQCPEVPAKTKNGCPEKKVITDVKIYLETSASMGGYFNPYESTEFKSVVTDLISKVNQNVNPVKIAFIAESTVRYNKSVSDFNREIATTSISPQKSSQLHRIIDQISTETGKGNVSILISDCILSFPDKDIKKNPEINRIQANLSLKDDIYNTFSKLKKKHYGAIVYAFTSEFFGTYYDYQNVKTRLRGEMRPFYIWVIGESDLLTQFDSALSDISTFKPIKSLHFGSSEKPVVQYDIIPQLGKKGKWSKTPNGLEDIELAGKEPLQFFIGLDLTQLPAYTQDLNYLQKNIRISAAGSPVKFQFRDKETFEKSKIKSEPQRKQFQNATHILMIEMANLGMSESQLQISLPMKYDTWYKTWSTMNDKSAVGRQNKTFAFEHLIAGVLEAYDSRNKEFIKFSINLIKD
ncbi:MAG: hypothetical protein V4721_03285 [Bacteroidota bacterium]